MNKKIISILIAVLVLGGFIFYKQRGAGNIAEGDGVVCTMDALICPDGSGVGRTGLKCEFSACPGKPYFEGKLVQRGEGFFLIIDAPEGVQEVDYAMPLKISRVSNTLKDLVNSQVRVEGKFITGNTYETTLIEKAAGGNTVTMRVGETKYINGVRLTVNKIVEDSRCQEGVVCVWAGRVVVSITAKSNTDEETFNLTSEGGVKAFDSYKISMASAAKNVFTIKVESN